MNKFIKITLLNMKTTVNFGKLIEQFAITPTINICSMQIPNKTIYDVQFAWLFWYVTIGKISYYLKSAGY